MQGTLVLAILSVQSSYLRGVEKPIQVGSGAPPDTIQWWIGHSGTWRIKTYALDHDIHIHSIGGDAEKHIELAMTNTRKHYGDVLQHEHIIDLVDCFDEPITAAAFRSVGLDPTLEVAERFVFWKPDHARYHTQSEPEQR